MSHVASLIGHEESNLFVFEVPPVNMKSLKAFFDSIMLKSILKLSFDYSVPYLIHYYFCFQIFT